VLAALTERLSGAGARYPGLAAALLVARGRRALDQPGFAIVLGIPLEHLRSLESGRRPPSHAPHRVAEVDDVVDWAIAGVLARDDPADAAARHPAAWPGATGGGGARIRPWERSGSNIG
jgi:hypothetical protein